MITTRFDNIGIVMSTQNNIDDALRNPICEIRNKYDLAAEAVVKELSGRKGLGDELDFIDDDIKEELIDQLSKTIANAIDHWEE